MRHPVSLNGVNPVAFLTLVLAAKTADCNFDGHSPSDSALIFSILLKSYYWDNLIL